MSSQAGAGSWMAGAPHADILAAEANDDEAMVRISEECKALAKGAFSAKDMRSADQLWSKVSAAEWLGPEPSSSSSKREAPQPVMHALCEFHLISSPLCEFHAICTPEESATEVAAGSTKAPRAAQKEPEESCSSGFASSSPGGQLSKMRAEQEPATEAAEVPKTEAPADPAESPKEIEKQPEESEPSGFAKGFLGGQLSKMRAEQGLTTEAADVPQTEAPAGPAEAPKEIEKQPEESEPSGSAKSSLGRQLATMRAEQESTIEAEVPHTEAPVESAEVPKEVEFEFTESMKPSGFGKSFLAGQLSKGRAEQEAAAETAEVPRTEATEPSQAEVPADTAEALTETKQEPKESVSETADLPKVDERVEEANRRRVASPLRARHRVAAPTNPAGAEKAEPEKKAAPDAGLLGRSTEMVATVSANPAEEAEQAVPFAGYVLAGGFAGFVLTKLSVWVARLCI